jgi:hypothetical protein
MQLMPYRQLRNLWSRQVQLFIALRHEITEIVI